MPKNNNSEYWEQRIANQTWKVYNSLEDKNRELLEFYTDASKDIKEELYTLAEKHSKDGVLSLSELHKRNRLTELNEKYEQIAFNLGKQTENTATSNMHDGFEEVYKNTGVSLGSKDFAMPNKKMMEKLLNEPWRGDSFSERLWKSQKKLATGLNDTLLIGLQQGKTVTEIAVNLHNFMGQAFNNCHRLVRTETMHYLNSASLQRYKDSGVEYVQVWCAQDERTCESCGPYHGKVYPIDKCPVLPFHPNCRCTIIPVTDEVDIKKLDLKFNKLDADSELGDRVKNVITKGVSGQLKDFRKGIEHVSNTHVKVLLKQSTDRVEFRRNNKNISSYSQNVVYLSRSASSGTIAHELFHEIDETYGITKSGLLKDTIKQDYEYVNNLARGYGKSIEEMLYSRYPKAFYINDKGRVIAKEEYRGISDILHGISNRKVYLGYGHNRPGYWERNNAVQIETWSQYGRILYESNVDVIKLVKQLFPKTSADVLLTLERMAK